MFRVEQMCAYIKVILIWNFDVHCLGGSLCVRECVCDECWHVTKLPLPPPPPPETLCTKVPYYIYIHLLYTEKSTTRFLILPHAV